ncbi:MAG: glycogen-binding domain-containing protein [Leptospiraceae bacterium]|nr:glycogen-binding domain-containing protein [Leptospiraceae bacterium]
MFPKISKKRQCLIRMTLLIGGVILAPGLPGTPDGGGNYVDGYNSQEGGLEDGLNERTARVYSLLQIQNLRRAIAPRYVRLTSYQPIGEQRTIIKKGILFTLEGWRSRKVSIAGDFNSWKPQAMSRGQYGVYYYLQPVLYDRQGAALSEYKYKFQVDGMWQSDAQNRNRIDDGLGGYVSVFHAAQPDTDRQIHARILSASARPGWQLVEFAIYRPSARNISLVSSFNNWNPEMDPMTRGTDGVFRYKKELPIGSYYYMYIIDGRWVLDTYNSRTRYHTGLKELVSYLEVDA